MEFSGGREDSTGVEEGRGKSSLRWALPPEGEPTPWTALGTRGEGGTGGGRGTTGMSRSPLPSSMSAPGLKLLSMSMDVHLAVIGRPAQG